ncbi:MAG: S-layer homology domain-containing protein, partial [Armatimonadetes bacterium]|nr:S-layer homology domain-containing protein [Armatimonadota bacterium]
ATLANGNIISGYPDGTFRPGNYITRAEIATIASKFDKLTPLEVNMFSDVSGHWAEEFINSAAQKGWVTGYPDGTFKPDQYITRAEFVTLVNNVLERRVKSEDILPEARQFPDLDKDAWYYEAMQEAINSHHYIRKPDTYEEWTEIYYPDLDM